jgi:hypothetical protein
MMESRQKREEDRAESEQGGEQIHELGFRGCRDA